MASDDAGAAASTNVLAVVTLDAVGTLAMVLFAFDGPLPEALIPRCPPPACCPPGTGPPPASCAAGGGPDGLQQGGDAENCLPAGQCVEGLWCSALGDILLLMVVRAFLAVSAVTGTRWLTSNCGLASTMVWHWLCTAYMAAKSLVAMDFAVRHVQGLTIVHGPVSVDVFTLLAAAVYSACIGWLQFSLVWKYRLAFRVFDPRLELPGMPFDSRVDGQGIGTWFESFYIQQRPRFDRSREPLLHPYDAFPLPPPARPEAPPEEAAPTPSAQQQRRQQRRRQRQQRQLADNAEEVPGEGRRLLEKSRSAPDSTGS